MLFKKRFNNWMATLQNEDGGFAHSTGERSDIEATRFAIEAFNELELQMPSRVDVCSWLDSIQKRFMSADLDKRSVRYVYYWAMSAQAVGVKGASRERLTNYVMSLYRPGSTFACSRRASTGDLDSALYALRILDRCGTKVPAHVADVVYRNCIRCCRNSGGYGLRPGMEPDLNATYAAFNILSLRKEPLPSRRSLVDWISACSSKAGGFGVRPGRTCRLGAMYWAMNMLWKSGVRVDDRQIQDHILRSHVTPDGAGFSDACVSTNSVPQIWPAYCAVRIFKGLGIDIW